MALIISDDNSYPGVKMNNLNFTISHTCIQHLKRGTHRWPLLVTTVLTGACQPFYNHFKRRLCPSFALYFKWTLEIFCFPFLWRHLRESENFPQLQQWSSCAATLNRPEDGLVIECVVMCWVAVINLCVVEFFLSSARSSESYLN